MAKRKSKNRASRSTRQVRARVERQRSFWEEMDPSISIDEAWDVYRANGFTDAQIRQILVGKQMRHKRPTRKIDGQVFQQLNPPVEDKRAANALADLQRQRGANARVIETKQGFSVYVAGSRRTYARVIPVHVDSATTLSDRIAADSYAPRAKDRKKRTLWQRLTTRRVKTGGMTHLEELEAQELRDFYRFKEELLKAGKGDATAFTQAQKAAQLKRAEAEDKIVRGKKAMELKGELRVAQEREDIANYKAARASYKEAVPLSTVAKYNSLEIATTSTGAIIGGGVAAATAAAAWPLIPIAALVGFISAKAIRRNVGGVGLKGGVNRSLDALDVGTSGLVEAVRVSKDQGQPNWRTAWLLREPNREMPKKPKSLKVQEREARRRSKKAERRAARIQRKRIREHERAAESSVIPEIPEDSD